MAERVRRVVRQTQARIFEGVTQLPGKLVSLFEPHTEIAILHRKVMSLRNSMRRNLASRRSFRSKVCALISPRATVKSGTWFASIVVS
jgi:hypothetical protein